MEGLRTLAEICNFDELAKVMLSWARKKRKYGRGFKFAIVIISLLPSAKAEWIPHVSPTNFYTSRVGKTVRKI